MRRTRGWLIGIVIGVILAGVTLQAQGPFAAQIQAALRAFLNQPHTWTAAQTFTGGCVGCGVTDATYLVNAAHAGLSAEVVTNWQQESTDVAALRRGTNGQELQVYTSFITAGNFDRLRLVGNGYAGSTFPFIVSDAAGASEPNPMGLHAQFGTATGQAFLFNVGAGAGSAAFSIYGTGGLRSHGLAHANLPALSNGSFIWCTDCTPASSPCTASGTGAFAYRVNSTWICPLSSNEASVTTTGNIAQLSSSVPVVRMNNASLATIQGIAAGVAGQRLRIVSIGAGQVDLAHQNGSATAADRLINFVTTGVTPLAAGVGTADLVYDATTARWRLVDHEQGAWIAPTFAAGDYTGNDSMTWTVESGDVLLNKYYIQGRSVFQEIFLTTTTVGGTPSTRLRVTIPNGYTLANAVTRANAIIVDNGTPATTIVDADDTTRVRFLATLAAAAWSAATNTTGVGAQLSYEVN